MKITVFGDSILKGVLLEDGKYRLNPAWERRLTEELGTAVCNRSHFGCTIRKALPAICRESERPAEAEDYVLLELGGNDCDYDWAAIAQAPEGRHRCKTPPETFASCYREAICRLRDSGRRPIALTLPPIHSVRYLDFLCRDGLSREKLLHWLGDVEAIARWQETYSELVRQLAREEHVELLDLRAAFPTQEAALEKLLCADGIHPSREGQERICHILRAGTRSWLAA